MGTGLPVVWPRVPAADRLQGVQEQPRRPVAIAAGMDQVAGAAEVFKGPVRFLRIDRPDPVGLVSIVTALQQARGDPLEGFIRQEFRVAETQLVAGEPAQAYQPVGRIHQGKCFRAHPMAWWKALSRAG